MSSDNNIMSNFLPRTQVLTSSDGLEIYADGVGNPDKPSIIFVHGLGLSGAVFNDIFAKEEYTTKFYLVRYDMRGHGRSGKPDNIEGYASNLYADDFAEVLRAFGLRKPVLVGWSLGATIAADVAAHLSADTLAGVVYLAGLPYTGPMLYQIATPEVLSLLPRLSREESVSSFVEANLEIIDALFIDPAQIEWETKYQWLGMIASQKPKYREFAVSRTQDPAGLFKLAEQGLPLLVLGGAHDKQVRSENVAQQMKPHFKNMELYLIEKGGSHAIFYENPEEIMAKIMEFTDGVGAKSCNTLDKSRQD